MHQKQKTARRTLQRSSDNMAFAPGKLLCSGGLCTIHTRSGEFMMGYEAEQSHDDMVINDARIGSYFIKLLRLISPYTRESRIIPSLPAKIPITDIVTIPTPLASHNAMCDSRTS